MSMNQARRPLMSGLKLTNVPYSQLQTLSGVLQKYRGTHYRLPPSAGPMALASSAVW